MSYASIPPFPNPYSTSLQNKRGRRVCEWRFYGIFSGIGKMGFFFTFSFPHPLFLLFFFERGEREGREDMKI